MFKTSFVQFSDEHITYNSRCFDGYLAFLPEPVLHSDATETNVSYRYFKGKDFCWFEFKDTKLSADLSMQITAPGSYLWLLINMRTGISLTLDSRHLVPTDMLLCYQTLVDDHMISLSTTKICTWMSFHSIKTSSSFWLYWKMFISSWTVISNNTTSCTPPIAISCKKQCN